MGNSYRVSVWQNPSYYFSRCFTDRDFTLILLNFLGINIYFSMSVNQFKLCSRIEYEPTWKLRSLLSKLTSPLPQISHLHGIIFPICDRLCFGDNNFSCLRTTILINCIKLSFRGRVFKVTTTPYGRLLVLTAMIFPSFGNSNSNHVKNLGSV